MSDRIERIEATGLYLERDGDNRFPDNRSLEGYYRTEDGETHEFPAKIDGIAIAGNVDKSESIRFMSPNRHHVAIPATEADSKEANWNGSVALQTSYEDVTEWHSNDNFKNSDSDARGTGSMLKLELHITETNDGDMARLHVKKVDGTGRTNEEMQELNNNGGDA